MSSLEIPVTNRMLALVCPDWSATVASHVLGQNPATDSVVVLHANRVISCTPAARERGVSKGLRKREAQARCSTAVFTSRNEAAETRLFDTIVTYLEQQVTGVEILEPGVCVLATRGPAKYFGGEAQLVDHLREGVVSLLFNGAPIPLLGIADGSYAARLAAFAQAIVAPGKTQEFLSPLPVTLLAEGDLADLFNRLGLHTIGQIAALHPPDVLGRFGWEGVALHQLAQAVDERQVEARVPPPNLAATIELENPAITAEAVVFAARVPAEELLARLANLGLSCRCVEVTVETEHGEHLSRRWRHGLPMTASIIVERVRWQLSGWLSGTVGADNDRPTAGVVLVRIDPVEVDLEGSHQSQFWGGTSAADERAAQGFARVIGLLGPDAVHVPILSGGRNAHDPVTTRLFVDEAEEAATQESVVKRKRTTRKSKYQAHPSWPGHLPTPLPTRVLPEPVAVYVCDENGQSVVIDSRLMVSAPPRELRFVAGKPLRIVRWAGPWPIAERWWDAKRSTRSVRFQCVIDTGIAYMLLCSAGQWTCTAMYD